MWRGRETTSAGPFSAPSSGRATAATRWTGARWTPLPSPLRPALAVFMPDRLVLVKGPPAARRAHLDRFASALWPARAEPRRRYGRALAQRNALLARVRGGDAPASALDAWDVELAEAGAALIEVRGEVCATIAGPFAEAAGDLGLEGEVALRYRPRAEGSTPDELAAELAARREADLARGFTTHGPHLDELVLERAGRALRRYGSQGESSASRSSPSCSPSVPPWSTLGDRPR